MSYDLMVFDQNVAPRDRADFLEWYADLTEWPEDRDYDSPDGMTGNLTKFYDAIRQDFPSLNGPFGPTPDQFEDFDELEEAKLTNYSLATHAIYIAFAWSLSEAARTAVVDTAIKTNVGFFDVSANDGIITYDGAELRERRVETQPVEPDIDPRDFEKLLRKLMGEEK